MAGTSGAGHVGVGWEWEWVLWAHIRERDGRLQGVGVVRVVVEGLGVVAW